MSNLAQFFGASRAPKSIVNVYAVAGWAATGTIYNVADINAGALRVLSGALTANVLKTILSITGSGVIGYLSISVLDATARTLRAKITIDGVVAYDYTSASTSTANAGAILISDRGTNAASPGDTILPFKTSFLLEIASNLTETDKVACGLRYWLT